MFSGEAEIVQKLIGTLNELPNSDAHLAMVPHHGGPDYDAQVEGHISGKPVTFIVEVKQQVYPRDVRQYLHQVEETAQRFRIQFDDNVLVILAAQSISQAAKEILRKESRAYYDTGGSLFVASNGLLVDRERPPAPSEERVVRTLFTGTRARVLLSMLDRPKDWTNVKELSAKAHVSATTASEVLQTMERNEWVATQGAGPSKQRRVSRPGSVLDAWASFVMSRKPPKQRRYYVPSNALDLTFELPKAFNRYGVDYAMTGEAAAQHFAPWLTQISVLRFRAVYSKGLDAALNELEAKPATEGTNLSILDVPSRQDLLPRTEDKATGVWYAHPIQIYLDLLKMEGRARDAANHLRRERIGF